MKLAVIERPYQQQQSITSFSNNRLPASATIDRQIANARLKII